MGVSAKEVTVSAGKSAIVVVIPFRLLNNFRRIQTRLVHELEKKFAKNVVIIAQRRILQKPGRNNRVKRQKRPMSRTLTSVHNAILDELVFPAEITGKRLRYKIVVLNNSKSTLIRKINKQWKTKSIASVPSTRNLPAKTLFSLLKANLDKFEVSLM